MYCFKAGVDILGAGLSAALVDVGADVLRRGDFFEGTSLRVIDSSVVFDGLGLDVVTLFVRLKEWMACCAIGRDGVGCQKSNGIECIGVRSCGGFVESIVMTLLVNVVVRSSVKVDDVVAASGATLL